MEFTDSVIQAKEVVAGGFLKQVPLSGSFDYSKLVPHVVDAERRFLIDNKMISEDFYSSLKSEVVNNISNYNSSLGSVVKKYGASNDLKTAYEGLWFNYLYRYLSYAVVCEALPFLNINIGGAGLSNMSGNHSSNIGVRGLKFYQDSFIGKVGRIRKYMVEYMCKNKGDFSLFDVDDEVCEDGCGDGIGYGDEDLGIIIY